MKLVSWNMHHAAKNRIMPEWVLKSIYDVDPGVIVLTEYVSNENDSFEDDLKDLGFQINTSVRAKNSKGHFTGNQVLVATKEKHELVSLEGVFSPAVCAVEVSREKSEPFIIVGLRLPIYLEQSAWEQSLFQILEKCLNKPALITGDFNMDLNEIASENRTLLQVFEEGGLRCVTPRQDSPSRKIDHLFLSKKMNITSDAKYSWEFLQKLEDVAHLPFGYPDHAMLIADIEVVK